MNSTDVFEGYIDRSWRFLAELQRSSGMEFVVGKRAGSYIWNLENTRRVLECANSGGVHSMGHRNPEILQALLDALGRFDAGIWTMPTIEALEFQDALAANPPCAAICRTVLNLSASDAIDLAIMFSFRVTGRRKVLAYLHGYHGHSGFASLVTGSADEGLFEHYSLPTDHSAFFREYGSLESIQEQMGPECAAIILEPMNYETFQPAPPGFLEAVADICRKNGSLLIIDETRTALGRSGRLWMTSHYSFAPDMLIIGKGLGGGLYPVSALATTRAIYDECMNSKRWGFMSSMAGSAIGAIVAGKVLEMAQRPALLENVSRLERDITRNFLGLCETYPDVYRFAWVKGGIAALGLKQESAARIIRSELFHRNVLCHSVSAIPPAVVKFFPCLTSDSAVVAEMTDALADFALHQRRTANSFGS